MMFVIRLSNELRRVFNSTGYNSADAIQFTLMSIPGDVIPLDSIVICIASILFFVQLRRSQELLMSQVIGISTARLIWKMLPALCLICAVFTLNREWVGPKLTAYANSWRAEKLSRGSIYLSQNRMWLYTQNGFLSAEISASGRQLNDLAYYEFEHKELKRWYVAPKANYLAGQWIARDVQHTDVKANSLETEHIPKKNLPIKLKPHIMAWSFIQPEYLSLWQIGHSLASAKKFGISGSMTWLLFTARIARPLNLLIIAMLVIAILERGVSLRFTGLSSRVALLGGMVACEFLVFHLLSTIHSGLTVTASAGVVLTIPFVLSIVYWLSVRKYRGHV